MNYARVEEIFRVTIFNGALDSLPLDFHANEDRRAHGFLCHSESLLTGFGH
jgi:hypothetical protein